MPNTILVNPARTSPKWRRIAAPLVEVLAAEPTRSLPLAELRKRARIASNQREDAIAWLLLEGHAIMAAHRIGLTAQGDELALTLRGAA